jgi:hypothetical protein
MKFYQMKRAKAFSVEEAFSFAKRTRKDFFLGSKSGSHFSRKYKSKDVEVYPDIFSFDPRYINFREKLSTKLRDRFDMNIRSDGFYDSKAIPTNFGELLTVAGVPMSPMTYTPVHNHKLRNDMGLCDGFLSDRHEKIFRELIGARYAEHDGSYGKISKISSSVFPLFSPDMRYKVSHLNLIAENAKQVLELAASGDLTRLYKNFGSLIAYEAVPRSQADGVTFDSKGKPTSKPREVNDLDFALSEGEHGRRFYADKSVFIEGSQIKGHFAQRGRTANGMTNNINAFFTTVFEGYRHYADTTYEATYKHRSRDEILRKFRKHPYVIGLDVKQYDQSIPEWMIDLWVELMPFVDNAKEMLLKMLKAPMFFSSVDDHTEAIWTGDPLDASYFNQWKGLPSGIFATSAIGKDLMTFAVLCLLDDYYHDVLGNVDAILKWKHSKYSISNMGDDSVLHIADKAFYDFLYRKEENDEQGLSEYFKIEVEQGIRFVGNVAYIDNEDKIQVCGDLGTYFTNMLVPERSLGSRHRQFGVFGLLERREVYSDSPSFFEAEEIFLKLWYDTFRSDWREGLVNRMKLPTGFSGSVISQADLEVLLDPSKLHYKYDEAEISSSTLSIIAQGISEKTTEQCMKAILK